MTELSPTHDVPPSDDDFEEAQIVRHMMRRQHRVLVSALLGVGCAMSLGGAFLVWQDLSGLAGACLLVCGVILIVRGALSGLTDIDTRDRKDFEKMQAQLAADTARTLGEAR